jgi:H+-translocating NAD(P) transhydrogenase subunit alpha
VVIVGETDLASQVAVHASQMYARNMEKLLLHVTRDGALALDGADPIVRAMLVMRDGAVVHEQVAAALAAATPAAGKEAA